MATGAMMDVKPAFISTDEQKQAASPKESVWVAAHAGSGKTHVLVDRVIRLMLAGAEPETILCLTFTRAAAAEMQRRLFDKLSQWTLMDDAALQQAMSAIDIKDQSQRAMNAARKLFTRALETPGGLRIQTIHAFAEKLLRLFPVEAGIAPGFKLLEDHQRRIMMEEARFHVMHQAEDGQDTDLHNALVTVSARANAETFEGLVESLLFRSELMESSVKLDLQNLKFLLKLNCKLDPQLTTDMVVSDVINIPRSEYDRWARTFSDAQPHFGRSVQTNLTNLLYLKNDAQLFQSLQEFYFSKELKQLKFDRFLNSDNRKLYPEAQDFFVRESDRIFNLCERYALIHRSEASAALLYLASRIHERFEREKQARGAVDFNDIIEMASALVAKRPSAQWVLYKLDRGLRHLLVDEAQDTNPDQWDIILALAEEFFAGKGAVEEKRTVFVVGDRKQSIYSFQGADAKEFERVREKLYGMSSSEHELSPVALRTSYRSVPEILNFVDHVFADGSFKDMGFEKEEVGVRGHASNRLKEKGVVEIWPTIRSEKAEDEDAWDLPIDLKPSSHHQKRVARKIAQVIESWIGKRRFQNGDVVKPGDILVLFRFRKVPFTELIAELRKLKVPVMGADRLFLGQSLAVQDLMALGQALILPDDDLSLATILKSWCVPKPLNEDQIFALAYNRGTKTLWQCLQELDDVNASYLKSLQQNIGHGPYVFFADVLQRFRRAMLERLGPEAGDASDVFLEFCLEYEQTQGTSIVGFLGWLQSSEIEFRREMSETSNQVRLMTVHGAKGLEARIVIIADAVWGGSGQVDTIAFKPGTDEVPDLPYWDFGGFVENPIIEAWKDDAKLRNQEESMRLLYVAMTRARDELYVAGSIAKDKPSDDCWKSYIEKRLKADTELSMREVASEIFEDEPIKRYGADPIPVDQFVLKELDENIVIPDWVSETVAVERSQKIQSVTGLVSSKSESFNRERILRMKRGRNAHLLLHELAVLPSQEWQAYAERRGRKLGLSTDDSNRLVQVLKSNDMQPFLDEGSRGEVETMLMLRGQRILGRVDRLTITASDVLLLDYKTGSKSDHLHTQDRNVQQLGLYAEGLREIYPNHAIRAALLWTDHGEISWIPENLLSQACDLALQKQHLDPMD